MDLYVTVRRAVMVDNKSKRACCTLLRHPSQYRQEDVPVPSATRLSANGCVAKILGDSQRQRTQVLAELQSYYLFDDKLGSPAKGNDKGKVGRTGGLQPILMP